MTKLGALIGLLLVAALPTGARATNTPLPYIRGAQDVSQLNNTLNTLINNINAILVPMQPNVPGAVNFISLTPAAAGSVATIGIQGGGDANASLGLTGAGNGDIVLFAGNTLSAGGLKFANSPGWTVAGGIAACPSVNPQNPPFGVHTTIQGFFTFKDWLDRTRYVPAC